MSDRPAASRSVENLKKEAKRWLRARRAELTARVPNESLVDLFLRAACPDHTSLRGPQARSNLVAHAALPGMSGAPP